MINRRTQEIKQKGFSIFSNAEEQNINQPFVPVNFGEMRVGSKTLEDAIINLGDYRKVDERYGDKVTVLTAIHRGDYETMRDISNFFYKTSGIYSRLCKYMAHLYKYDWYITPYLDKNNKKTDNILENFQKVLRFTDDFGVKKFFGDVSLKVIRFGCYYGYIVENNDGTVAVQELPARYCRSRYFINNVPAVEFNLKFFKELYRTEQERERILKAFPSEFRKAWKLYEKGRLKSDIPGEEDGWYLLDPEYAVKFNLDGEDFPAFIATIPAIIDLDGAKELDRKKMTQQLLKIIIQKMPTDKNGDLIFDVEEARELHMNAVKMLSKAVGIDVLTTFADTSVETLSDSQVSATHDELEKVERSMFNEAGIAKSLFNTDTNLALEKSILNDEAALSGLMLQYEEFMNRLLKRFNKNPKKMYFRFQFLPTTVYNYQALAKVYKEQMQIGFSKILPQVALGNSQSSILATAYFENDILDLVNLFIPPLMSSTMSANALSKAKQQSVGEEKQQGRPTKESQGEDVSDKTILNKESAN